MRDSELVHAMELLPCFALDIEEVDFSISVSVLTSNQYDLILVDR